MAFPKILQAPDVSGWAETARITRIEFRPNDFIVQFDKQSAWPDVTPPGWDGPIQYTLWAVVRGMTTGCIEFWRGRTGVGGPYSEAAKNWYYFVPEMAGIQPAPGETVGFFVTAGDQRRKDVRSVMERSSIVYVTVPAGDSGVMTFTDTPAQQPDPQPVPAPAPAPSPAPSPAPAPAPAADVVGALGQLAMLITSMDADLNDLRKQVSKLSQPAVAFPDYVGSVFGATVVLKPRK